MADPAKAKLNRVDSLMRVRKTQLEIEAGMLARIHNEIAAQQQVLVKHQNEYIRGVNDLNALRQKTDLSQLPVMESGLDLVKLKWYRVLKTLRDLQSMADAQRAQVMVARRNLKTVETLEERYLNQSRQYQDRIEQKHMDEVGLRSYLNKSNGNS